LDATGFASGPRNAGQATSAVHAGTRHTETKMVECSAGIRIRRFYALGQAGSEPRRVTFDDAAVKRSSRKHVLIRVRDLRCVLPFLFAYLLVGECLSLIEGGEPERKL